MPIKQATIRFGVEVAQDAQSKMDQLDKMIAGGNRKFQQLYREAQQARAGVGMGTVASGDAAAAEREAVRASESLSKLTSLRALEKVERNRIENNNSASALASKRAAEAHTPEEMSVVSKKIGDETTRQRLQAQQDQFNNLKTQAEKEYAYMKAYHQAHDIENASVNRSVAAWEKGKEKKAKIARGDAEHNEKASMAQARRDAAQQKRDEDWFDRQQVKAQKTGMDGPVSKGFLKSMGGKFVMGHAVGQMVGDITGNQDIAAAGGSIATAFLMGGAITGGITTAMMMVGEYFKEVREGAVKTTGAMQAYSDSLLQMTRQSAEYAIGLGTNSAFGKVMKQQSDQAFDSAMKIKDAVAIADLSGANNRGFFEWFASGAAGEGAYESSPTGQARATQLRQARAFMEMSATERKESEKERGFAEKDARRMHVFELAAVGEGGPQSLSRKNKEMEANIRLQQEQLKTKQAEEIRGAEASITLAHSKVIPGKSEKAKAADDEVERAEAALTAMKLRHSEEEAIAEEKATKARADMLSSYRVERLVSTRETEDMATRALYVGYQREEQLAKDHFQRMRDDVDDDTNSDATRKGALIFRINEQERTAKKEREANRERELASTFIRGQEEAQLERAVRRRDITREEADLEMTLAALRRDMKLTPENEIEAHILAGEKHEQRIEAEKMGFADRMAANKIEIEYMQRRIGMEGKLQALLKLNHPELDNNALAAMARSEMELMWAQPQARGTGSTGYGYGNFGTMWSTTAMDKEAVNKPADMKASADTVIELLRGIKTLLGIPSF